jgi:hypothetical protein
MKERGGKGEGGLGGAILSPVHSSFVDFFLMDKRKEHTPSSS